MQPPQTKTQAHLAEEFRWNVGRIPSPLEGKIVSKEELKKAFPQTDKFWRVTLTEQHKHHNIYGRPRKENREMTAPVAYTCRCIEDDEAIVGPPKIESINPYKHFAKPEEYRKISCTNCSHNLEGDILDAIS